MHSFVRGIIWKWNWGGGANCYGWLLNDAHGAVGGAGGWAWHFLCRIVPF